MAEITPSAVIIGTVIARCSDNGDGDNGDWDAEARSQCQIASSVPASTHGTAQGTARRPSDRNRRDNASW